VSVCIVLALISKNNTKHVLVNIYKRNFESSERLEQ